jgi:hypothetical protein
MGANNQKPAKNNVELSLLILLLGIGSCYFLSQSVNEKPKQKIQHSESSSIKEDRADGYYRQLYLRKMRQEMQIDNERARSEARKGIPTHGQQQKIDSQTWPGVGAEQEQAKRFEDEKSARDFDVLTPEDRIQYEIKKRQDEEYATEQMRREFIRQLQENARKDGIEIRVDKNLRAYPVGPSPQ